MFVIRSVSPGHCWLMLLNYVLKLCRLNKWWKIIDRLCNTVTCRLVWLKQVFVVFALINLTHLCWNWTVIILYESGLHSNSHSFSCVNTDVSSSYLTNPSSHSMWLLPGLLLMTLHTSFFKFKYAVYYSCDLETVQ